MKYYIKIFGCQYNEWDGARLDYLLQKNGLILSDEKSADIIFAIACSVRKSAVDRLLGKVKNWRQDNKKVIISGCLLSNDKKKIEARGTVFCDADNTQMLFDVLGIDKPINQSTNQPFNNCSYLPIMSGCNNFCSYCVVPYTKGREKSRDFNQIVKEFKKLVEAGHKEITLLGQNVNSYKAVISTHPEPTGGWIEGGEKSHHKKNKTISFAHLLKTLNNIPGDFQILFTSNHPKDMNDDIIKVIANLPKVKKEIHLPLQSGSNKILKAMNRPYTKEQYINLIARIKKAIPDIKISTDIIVGFPGETEEDFLETKDLIKKIGFYWVFANKYSPREGTASFKLGDPIPWAEKQRRWREIDKLVNKKNSKG